MQTNIIWQVSKVLVDYPEAIQKMEEIVNNIVNDGEKETVWLLEHPPLYTAGSSAAPADLLYPDKFPVYQSGRGGKFTYHGPGQRVAYFMLDLKKRFEPNPPDLRRYIFWLEELVIQTLREFGVVGERREGRVGIWVDDGEGEKKIAAIGVRVRKWVAYHGIAVNISPDLGHFSGIVPCGIAGHGIASLKSLGKTASLEQFDEVLKARFSSIFQALL